MSIIEQIEALIDSARDEGREPLMVRIMPDNLAIVEADAEARQVLGRGTIFGIPYEPGVNSHGQGAIVVCRDALPE